MFNPERPPEITASRWLNADKKLTLKAQKGKVVFVTVCQIACPGSVKYGLPQAMRIRGSFSESEVSVLGLHMAFENFAAQSPAAVEQFLKDSGITIPVAYDKPNGESLPQTMSDYELQGTPAILLFDRQGRLRRHYLGAVDDLRLGAEIMALLIEDKESPREMSIALERKLAAALINPEDHDHVHGPGCGHDHSHDHSHHHGHATGGRLDEGESPGAKQNAAGAHVHGPDCKH